MTHIWKQTITINEDIARELIENQQHIHVESIQLLDEGWDNLVYLVNKNLIFRFPRRELGVFCMENEILLLPYITKQVSFPLSNPEWIGEPSDLYPYPYGGYKMLRGLPLCDAADSLIDNVDFAVILATWLNELHSLKVNDNHISVIKGDQSWRLDVKHRVARCHENLERYQEYFLQAGFKNNQLIGLIEKLSSFQFQSLMKFYLHGDLYCRHVIVDTNHFLPTGLIDWGDVHIGHRGIDLSIGMVFTKPTLEIFLNAYGNVDEELIRVMVFHSFCHSMSFLPYAFQQNKKSLKQWAALVLQRAMDEIKTLNI
ncbi:MAG: phosphotransferase [uncultured bacterium]|nr:MAG: phosphotransferase [uncultured bacterium]